MRNEYLSGEDGRDSEEVDISLMSCLNVSIGDLQEEVKGSFWEIVSCQVVFIAFEKLPGLSGLIQTIIDSPHLLHAHVFEGRKG